MIEIKFHDFKDKVSKLEQQLERSSWHIASLIITGGFLVESTVYITKAAYFENLPIAGKFQEVFGEVAGDIHRYVFPTLVAAVAGLVSVGALTGLDYYLLQRKKESQN